MNIVEKDSKDLLNMQMNSSQSAAIVQQSPWVATIKAILPFSKTGACLRGRTMR